MSHVLKVDGWDIGLAAGPVAARKITFSGLLQGGHAGASWEVPVANAYLRPHHILRRGAWAVLYDGEHELWEGQILSVRPSVDISGQHKFLVTGGGLISVAAKRRDLSKTWVHRGAADWRIHPEANRSGEYTIGSDGYLRLLIRAGAKEDYVTPMRVVYYLDNLLSDDYISFVDCEARWDVTSEGTYNFSWSLFFDGVMRSEANTWSDGTSFDKTPSSSVRVVGLDLSGIDYYAYKLLTFDKYVEFTKIDVFGSSRTAKIRVDEALCDIMTMPGLAVSFSSQAIGKVLDDLHFSKTSAAQMLTDVAGLHAQPVDYGFWDERSARAKPLDRRPLRLDQVVVVGGGNPGLVSWDVTPVDQDRPDFVAVYYRGTDEENGSDHYPEGMERVVYVPYEPDDSADWNIEVVDYSSLILTEAAAVTAGAQLLGVDGEPYELPAGAVFSAHPEYAKQSMYPGNNTDPTSSWTQVESTRPAGTLTGFGYTGGSGWTGSNTPLDPTCLEFDGTDDFVTWGDEASLDFGTGPFTFIMPFRLDELDKAQVLAQKWDSVNNNGWELVVTKSNNLLAYVEMGLSSKYAIAIHAEQLSVGRWYWAGISWSGTTTRALTLYLDGVSDDLYSAGAATSPESISTSTAFKIGAA